ncbi:O-antigen ligase family protein [Neorhizobium lilium]|uniref:O-antigen ligase family protein n=1 Tax=Neorhizobium lilium TaxID=2503024 RepID=A0A3S3VQ49_9HYPH|nr:O-antigen ligase [Neorhizobium lilium]RWX79325.1 O-antigen ligase family protein [Neorhizobium lilium]
MKIASSSFIDPRRNQIYAMMAVAISFFVFAYSSRFGQISILAYYGAWFLLVLVNYRKALGSYGKYLWIFGFGLFCFVSAFWSPAFGVSLRTAIQYLTHIACALIAMRAVSIENLSKGAILGVGLVLVYSIVFGTYLLDSMDGTFGFVGAFSSKNQLGFFASLGIFFCYAGVMVFRLWGLWLPVIGVVALFSAYCLFASQSATSAITTIGVVALCIGMQSFMIFSPRHRRMFFAAAMVMGIGAVVGGLQFGAMDAILGLFGKDSTLTGRTYLWQQGIAIAQQSPYLGIGYQGFWVPGFADAERLWDDFGITGKSGFHFHNTYIETTVETGVIGALLLVFILLTTLTGHLKRLLTFNTTPDSLVLFGLTGLLLIRSFVEIDIINPYQVGSFLFYFAAGRLAIAPLQVAEPRRAAARTAPAGLQPRF